MHTPEKVKERHGKMIEHLAAAQAFADETRDSAAGYLIERTVGRVLAARTAPPEVCSYLVDTTGADACVAL